MNRKVCIYGNKNTVFVCDSYEEMSFLAAEIVAAEMKKKPEFLLGLATGSTPVGLYRELAKKNAAGEISFAKTKTYNLDEYYPIDPECEQSFFRFMKDNLFDHINLPPENIHIPRGNAPDPILEAARYEKELMEIGGVDVQILGIGSDGHIGFNEPNGAYIYQTHMVELTRQTILDNSRFFASEKDVPTHALTMGIGTIMRAKRCILLAEGENKASAIRDALVCPAAPNSQASILQFHSDTVYILDRAAAKLLPC